MIRRSQELKRLFILIWCISLHQPLHPLKINRVILSTDANPTYIEFWPVVAKVWKQLLGIQPTLALIADDSVHVDESLGDVIRLKPIEGVPTAQYAQLIRLLLPIYFEDDVCIISDIDMIPLCKDYFVNSVTHIPQDCFVVYRDKAYQEHERRYPMCYNAALGKTFKEVFKINNPHEIPELIKKWYALGLKWDTDELMLYWYLSQWPDFQERCIKLGHETIKRVDRSFWNYDALKVRNLQYIDAHCLRPYSQYQQEIDALIQLLVS